MQQDTIANSEEVVMQFAVWIVISLQRPEIMLCC